jgi:hypothetical protein
MRLKCCSLPVLIETTLSNPPMAVNQNFAAWLPGVGKQIEIGHADIPEPGPGELLVEVSCLRLSIVLPIHHHLPSEFITLYIVTDYLTLRQVKAVAVQPAEYKIQQGTLPFPLKYPTIIGCQCIRQQRVSTIRVVC